MKPKTIQGVLIPDENLRADLAELLPVASKITDAAATYIAKTDKKFGDETISSDTLRVIGTTIELAQEVVKYGAAINRILRNPSDTTRQLHAEDIRLTRDGESK